MLRWLSPRVVCGNTRPEPSQVEAYRKGSPLYQQSYPVLKFSFSRMDELQEPIITLGIITFLASWNDFSWPLLTLGGDRQDLTLSVSLATLQG